MQIQIMSKWVDNESNLGACKVEWLYRGILEELVSVHLETRNQSLLSMNTICPTFHIDTFSTSFTSSHVAEEKTDA